MNKLLLLLIALTCCITDIQAQATTDFDMLTKQRRSTDATGNILVGCLSAANFGTGIGLLSSNYLDPVSSGLALGNVGWCIVDGVMAISRAGSAQSEEFNRTTDEAYGNFESRYAGRRSRYGFDLGMIGAGTVVALASSALLPKDNDQAKVMTGIGLSTALNGALLFAIDNYVVGRYKTMNSQWMKIVTGIQVGSNSIGLVYRF